MNFPAYKLLLIAMAHSLALSRALTQHNVHVWASQKRTCDEGGKNIKSNMFAQ